MSGSKEPSTKGTKEALRGWFAFFQNKKASLRDTPRSSLLETSFFFLQCLLQEPSFLKMEVRLSFTQKGVDTDLNIFLFRKQCGAVGRTFFAFPVFFFSFFFLGGNRKGKRRLLNLLKP